jgi:hypothetical protein
MVSIPMKKKCQKPKLTKYGELRNITFSHESPDDIAKRGQVGIFSENSLYDAFKDAGYSDEDARSEAQKRVQHLD